MAVSQPCVIIDNALPGHEQLLCFTAARRVVTASEPNEAERAFREIELAVAGGAYAAGYMSYELGYLIEPRLRPLQWHRRRVPLLWFGVFDQAREIRGVATSDYLKGLVRGRAYAGPLRPEWTQSAYETRFDRVQRYIGSGDIYQANLSFRSRFRFRGDPVALYLALREQSKAGHCAYVDDGSRQILSLSPELFFDLSADRGLTARPMKGTAPRSPDPAADETARLGLAASEKDRAENVMIVDLLRNDIGRVAETGSVGVASLFAVQTFPTLHQMVSTITGKLREGVGGRGVIGSLFPCGSVTGAPKIRAMEIIRELEDSPRGVYCGAIGCFGPDGSARFNVAIRTITLEEDEGELGIGGAIVSDSDSRLEYAECLLKARYFDLARRPIELIETMGHVPGSGVPRLELHLDRLESSAASFGVPFDRTRVSQAISDAALKRDRKTRLRLLLSESGAVLVEAQDAPPPAAIWRFVVSNVRTDSTDLFLRHKTSWRELCDGEWARARDEWGCDEVLFLNEKGEVTEGSRSNVFVKYRDLLLTPPLSSGVLNGCLRQELIANGLCHERVLCLEDLERADGVYFGNSLRGLIPAVRMME